MSDKLRILRRRLRQEGIVHQSEMSLRVREMFRLIEQYNTVRR